MNISVAPVISSQSIILKVCFQDGNLRDTPQPKSPHDEIMLDTLSQTHIAGAMGRAVKMRTMGKKFLLGLRMQTSEGRLPGNRN